MERIVRFFSDVNFLRHPSQWEADELSIAVVVSLTALLVAMLPRVGDNKSDWDKYVEACHNAEAIEEMARRSS